jgi:hypothetical protein
MLLGSADDVGYERGTNATVGVVDLDPVGFSSGWNPVGLAVVGTLVRVLA